MAGEQQHPKEEEKELTGGSSPSSPPRHPRQFLEVLCNSSGEVRRFAAGTEAGYALYLINRKLEFSLPQALYIEAGKEGEEPVSFGPNAVLVNYGQGWRLHTVIEEDHGEVKRMKVTGRQGHYEMNAANPLTEKRASKPSSKLSLQYIGKILLAFVFIFLLGGILTLFLENLPTLLSFFFPST